MPFYAEPDDENWLVHAKADCPHCTARFPDLKPMLIDDLAVAVDSFQLWQASWCRYCCTPPLYIVTCRIFEEPRTRPIALKVINLRDIDNRNHPDTVDYDIAVEQARLGERWYLTVGGRGVGHAYAKHDNDGSYLTTSPDDNIFNNLSEVTVCEVPT